MIENTGGCSGWLSFVGYPLPGLLGGRLRIRGGFIMNYLETPRLRLRDWEEEDLKPFSRLNADEQVMRYFPKTLSPEETAAFYRTIVSEFLKCGFGLYAVEVKESKEFIGFIGFHRATFESDFTPCVEIGWRLKKEAWGRGYATEGAAACLRYGLTELGLDDVYSFTAEVNEPSKNVMRKIGMSFVKTFAHPRVESSSPLSKHVLFHIRF
jgi:ribosomal-protein-alanine N-acetyltransferase